MNFQEMLQALKDGKKITNTRSSFSYWHWVAEGTTIMEKHNIRDEKHPANILYWSSTNEGWVLYSPLTFKNLKPGQKFRYIENPNKGEQPTLTRVVSFSQTFTYLNERFEVVSCADINHPVELVS